jgi:hypothetical protein
MKARKAANTNTNVSGALKCCRPRPYTRACPLSKRTNTNDTRNTDGGIPPHLSDLDLIITEYEEDKDDDLIIILEPELLSSPENKAITGYSLACNSNSQEKDIYIKGAT